MKMKMKMNMSNNRIVEKNIKGFKKYIIVDDNNKIISDANGFGFKSYDKAKAFMNYKSPIINF